MPGLDSLISCPLFCQKPSPHSPWQKISSPSPIFLLSSARFLKSPSSSSARLWRSPSLSPSSLVSLNKSYMKMAQKSGKQVPSWGRQRAKGSPTKENINDLIHHCHLICKMRIQVMFSLIYTSFTLFRRVFRFFAGAAQLALSPCHWHCVCYQPFCQSINLTFLQFRLIAVWFTKASNLWSKAGTLGRHIHVHIWTLGIFELIASIMNFIMDGSMLKVDNIFSIYVCHTNSKKQPRRNGTSSSRTHLAVKVCSSFLDCSFPNINSPLQR